MQLVTRHSSFVTARPRRALVTLAAVLFAATATTVRAESISINNATTQRVINKPDDDFKEILVDVSTGENVDISVGSVANDAPDLQHVIFLETHTPDIWLNVEGEVSSTTHPYSWDEFINTAIWMRSRDPDADFKVTIGGNVTAATTSDKDFKSITSQGILVGTNVGGKSDVEITGIVSAIANGSMVEGNDSFYDYEVTAQAFLIASYEEGETMVKAGGGSANAIGLQSGETDASAVYINAGDAHDQGTGKVLFTSGSDLVASAASAGPVNVTGVYMNTEFGDSRIDLTVENGGGINATATGSGGTVYGLYADTDAGTINALVDGDVTQTSDIRDPYLGGSAGILVRGVGGAINIQVGNAVTNDPPETLVSGSDAGIINYSNDSVTKNIVVWGKVSGGTTSVLTGRNLSTTNFNLTVWEIEPNEIDTEQHTAAALVNGQAKSDDLSRNIENNIRYIILMDPDFAKKVEIRGANEGTDLKGETYYWANLGDTVTLVSTNSGYHISKAWRDTEKSKALTCDLSGCSFEVPLEGGIWLDGTLEAIPPLDVTQDDGVYGEALADPSYVQPFSGGEETILYSGTNTIGTTYGPTAEKPAEAGGYTVAVTYVKDNTICTGRVDFVISRRAVTFSGQSETNAYTGSEIEITGVVVSNLVFGHTYDFTFSAKGTEVGLHAGAVKSPDSIVIKSGEENVTANYAVSVRGGALTITKAANAWVHAPSIAGWTVGATPATPNMGAAKFGTATIAYGVAGGAAGDLGATCPSTAGNYTATFTVPGTANYAGLSKTVSFTVKPKPTYTVIFDANGGKGGTTAKKPAGAALKAPTVTRAGYRLKGWSPAVPAAMPAANVTYKAVWTPLTYTVRFDANGGTLPKGKSMAAQTFTPGKAAKLRGNAFTRKGFVFIGWSTRKDGPVAYRNTQSVNNLVAAGKSVTLYAAWAKAEYKVVFDASGGRLPKGVKMPTQTFKYGKAQKLNGNKFTRKGYVFGGWAIRDPLATVPKIAYRNGQSVANLSRDGRTVKLYAVWKRR